MGGDGQSNNNQQGQHTQSSGQSSTTGGMLGGIGDRISSALGGKQHSEDAVNKGAWTNIGSFRIICSDGYWTFFQEAKAIRVIMRQWTRRMISRSRILFGTNIRARQRRRTMDPGLVEQ